MGRLRQLATAASGSAASGSGAAGQLPESACVRATRNTLTTQCYSACKQEYPLCINYAALPASPYDVEGDGNYYYQGCPTAMATCHPSVGAAQCQLQCLQSRNPNNNTEWILDVAPPQTDRLETSLFVSVDKLELPKTLKHLKLVGTTEHSRKVPIRFAPDAFASGTGLEKITLMDLGINNISFNIFPASLSTLIMQRTQLTEFNPAGGDQMTSLTTLDLSENFLTTIPDIVYLLPNLTLFNLAGNNMSTIQLNSTQLNLLQKIKNLGLPNDNKNQTCEAGYIRYTWDKHTACYKDAGATGSSVGDTLPQSDNNGPKPSSTTAQSGRTGLIIAALVAAVVLAILAGVFLLKRAKKRKEDEARRTLTAAHGDDSRPQKNASKIARMLKSHKSNDLANPLRDGNRGDVTPTRKATFREIPASEVQIIDLVTETSIVTVSVGEWNKKKVLVNKLRVSDDPAENCETALSVTPVVAQLRHPQLLTVIGFMWEDVHTMSAICEHMNRGTLEDHLLTSATALTWRNFKLKAAMDVAGCLMYLHSQSHKLTYDALSGRTVFVDSEKGCKLSTMIACLPNGMVKSQHAKSTRGFCAPEVIAGDASTSASDMYAYGVLLAQLDTCETADEMIRTSLRQRSLQDNPLFNDSTGGGAQDDFTTSGTSSISTNEPSGGGSSLLSIFAFKKDCPDVVRELAFSCLQIDPKMRPSAQYVTAMLQHSV